MMGAFAEFERNIIKKRQAEGIAKAKAKGVYKGTKKRIDRAKVHQMKAEGFSTYKIADEMGISRMSVHRILNTEAAWSGVDVPTSEPLVKLFVGGYFGRPDGALSKMRA